MLRFERMPNAQKVLQPRSYSRFRCTGSDCEDTCCEGWSVNIDRVTYEKYKGAPETRVGDLALAGLVEINPIGTSSVNFATIRMDGIRCPALQGGLCSIHQALGEPFLADLCSTFPRVLNVTGDVMERALHLSCPEAARLVLADPEGMVFEERTEDSQASRPGSITPLLFDSGDVDLDDVDSGHGDYLHQVRALIIELIQERSRPLWQRIVSLGLAMERLAGLDLTLAVPVMADHLKRFRAGELGTIPLSPRADPVQQLETALELIVFRLGLDYTSPRFLECYRELMDGLLWTDQSSMTELGARYSRAATEYFLPFVSRHPYLLENYLVNYIFRTLFPYRRKRPDQSFVFDSGRESMRDAFLLLGLHYSLLRTLLIGAAAWHKEELRVDHAIQLVQSYSRAFQHIASFEAHVLEVLRKGPEPVAQKIAVLVMD